MEEGEEGGAGSMVETDTRDGEKWEGDETVRFSVHTFFFSPPQREKEEAIIKKK